MIKTLRLYLETGKTIAEAKSTSRISETCRIFLHRLVTGYGIDHYLAYSLFEKPVSIHEWRQYLDKKDFCKLLFRYNRKRSFRELEDKVAFGYACRRHNLPHPDIAFTCNYSSQDSPFPDLSEGNIASGFSSLVPGGYIVKTCGGSYGLNLWSIEKTSDGDIQVHNLNQRLSAQKFATLLENTNDSYLVQKKIEAARSLRPLMPGLACGSIRIYTFLRPDGTVSLPFSIVKITIVGAISDNFANGTSGNLTAMIDMESRRIQHVVGKTANGLYREVTHHPDTGVDMRNYAVPELQQALDLGRRCALAFPEIPAVGWDIVVTEQGPVVLEGNPMFDPYGPQWCENGGVRDIIPRLLGDPDSTTA